MLRVYFCEELLSSGDFSFVIVIWSIMVSPGSDYVWEMEYLRCFVPTAVANSSVKQPLNVTRPLIP